ncbi:MULTISPECIES: DsbA family protein [Pseudovibrio]|uniref:DsbA family oxidoreductase n=1 Tax=Stappiaceae TaxID=2821832 RepID=UPI0023653C64|nr:MULTISPECIES: DsbA family protein [Pseudovibrio]MDD7910805.1 DsbA family protein [Pseudovibrio exalbescens]MDX5593487.1 DsbA family protein [Pseudovibrio sp. SPO723]
MYNKNTGDPSNSIVVYTDYVCPYCLLAETVIRRVIDGHDVPIEWRPYELRPDPVPTLRVEDPYLPTVWERSVYPMAEELGVPIKLPQISPQPRTQKAFEGFQLAQEKGLGEAYSNRFLRAFFQEEQDIGDIEVIVRLGEEVGLDGAELREALDKGTYAFTHRKALEQAKEQANISAVPTIFIGDRRLQGVPSEGELRAALQEAGLLKATAQNSTTPLTQSKA